MSMRAGGSPFNLRTNHHAQPANGGKGGTASSTSRSGGIADSLPWSAKTFSFGALLMTLLALICFYFMSTLQAVDFASSGTTNGASVSTSSSAATTPPKASRKGLYGSSNHVLEVISEAELHQAKSRQDGPVMIVFYAAWCGHCRRFSPIFSSIADKITTRTESLNGNLAGTSPFPLTQFFAVDCVSFRSLCDQERITAYPTVIARNFPGATGETKLVGVENTIMQHFRTFLFKHGELDSSFANGQVPVRPTDGQSVGSSAADSIARHNASAAFLADRKARHNDLMTSFFFFLAREMPSEVPQDQLATLRAIASLLRYSTAEEHKALRSLLDEVLVVILKYSKAVNLPSNKVKEIVQKQLPGLASQTSSKKTSLRSSSVALQWQVCGVGVSSSSSLSSSRSPHTDGARGYTCGLWMLFHHLSVLAAGRTWEEIHSSDRSPSVSLLYSTGPVQVTDVLSLIKDFVASFFGCIECRTHFLHYYQQAWFDREHIQSWNDLQFWLLRLHNLVNLRIAYTASSPLPSNEQANATALDAQRQEISSQQARVERTVERIAVAARRALWPTSKECPACHRRNLEDILQDLRQQSDLVQIYVTPQGHVDHERIMRDLIIQLMEKSASVEYLQKQY